MCGLKISSSIGNRAFKIKPPPPYVQSYFVPDAIGGAVT